MHYHIILTDQCNSECRYCYQKSLKDVDSQPYNQFAYTLSAPDVSQVDVKTLKKFLEKDKDPVLIFYGGEPLLYIEKVKEIIDTIDVPFRMQTNGLLLNELPPPYLAKIQKILVSLDGTKERTNFNRGKKTYETVMKNLSLIKPWYKGEIIARMTIAQEFPDIYEQVLSLLADGFTSVHWQLDAGFYASDFNLQKFNLFVNCYRKSIGTLANYWVTQLKKGTVYRLYPFIGVVSSFLKNENPVLPCGAGHHGYTITTNGTIVACPITNHSKDFVAGTLEIHPHDLKKFAVSGRCLHCHIYHICGGRCLYWNKASLWPEEGNNLICKTVEYLVKTLEYKIPEIKELLKNKIIKQEDLEYEKYFGPEIIP